MIARTLRRDGIPARNALRLAALRLAALRLAAVGLAALGLASFGLAGPGLAQEATRGPAGEQFNEAVLVTKLHEAYQKKEWKGVVDNYLQLRDSFPAAITAARELTYYYAEAQYNQKQLEPATTALDSLLEHQPDHVKGLFLLATIRAQGKTDVDKERAKELLLEAARAGQYVLRDISSAEGRRIFGPLMSDPAFILRIMNASNEFQVSTGGLRNPFRSPLRTVDPDDRGQVITTGTSEPDHELVELERRVEALFRDIEKLAQDRAVEELIGKFTELRAIMNEHGDGGAMVKQKLDRWLQRLAQYAEVIHSIQLQIYINEGNQHLRFMAESIQRDEFDAALERFEQIKDLKDQMYAEERDVFHRNAEALFLRGKALADRAERLKRISEFRLTVSGIVLAPPAGEEQDSAIINDRIYHEGEAIVDEDSDEEIEGLRVVEIIRSTVRFRFEDTEFVRELRTP